MRLLFKIVVRPRIESLAFDWFPGMVAFLDFSDGEEFSAATCSCTQAQTGLSLIRQSLIRRIFSFPSKRIYHRQQRRCQQNSPEGNNDAKDDRRKQRYPERYPGGALHQIWLQEQSVCDHDYSEQNQHIEEAHVVRAE